MSKKTIDEALEELKKVPKDLNEVLPPIENYRPLNKTTEEIIEDGKKMMDEMEKGDNK